MFRSQYDLLSAGFLRVSKKTSILNSVAFRVLGVTVYFLQRSEAVLAVRVPTELSDRLIAQ